ncbi:acyl-CoA dehydrogenase family protein [Celeribacter arenosi]|uniref:Acyl-CoA dehydrogenase n=1 Tax=Celeribacter arenosi TaxID=792649 RepID=A0ABP7K4F0_9RHOB
MTPFSAPVEDILFSLRDVAGAARVPDWDADLTGEIIAQFARFAEDIIAPLDESGDAQGCRLDAGRVVMPDGFKEAYGQLAEGGWQGLTLPEDHGGMALDPLTAAAVSEVFSGACHSLQMICNLVPGAAATLRRFGSPDQQGEWLPKLASGAVLSTMCLTEAGAGSDLSRIRTRATRDGENWALTGDKIFISGGDQNLSDDILHLVLARTGTPGDGIKGLSLFLTSKSGAGEAISITRIEEKLGLHASPTCQIAFDDAPAELLGHEGAGLAAMFTMMNHARIDVALQGVAHASRAHHIAQSYATTRQQGRKPDGRDAMLADHADVARMLADQESLSLGARAMAHIALVEMALGARPALVDFLTPVCKVFCTEAGIRAADLGIQILGGYGYLTEYRIAQTWRDARITAIYEGANGIHAAAIATRGLKGEGGDHFAALIGELTDNPRVLALLARWNDARTTLTKSATPTAHAHDFMALTSTLFYRAVWCKIAAADPARAPLRDHVLNAPLPIGDAAFT